MDKITVSTQSLVTALTDNGSANGYVKVADNTLFFVGTLVNLRDANGLTMECIVTEVTPDTLYLGLAQLIGNKGKARTDLSAFTVANTATIYMTAQVLSGYNEQMLTHIGYVA